MKILVSRPDKIGDVILALHGIKQLKLALPHAQVYIHIAEYTKALVDNVSFLDGVVAIDEDLKRHGFDASIDLMAKYQTARMYAAAKIPLRIGNLARWHSFFYNRFRSVRRSRAYLNEAEYNWQLIRLIDPTLRHTRLQTSLEKSDFITIPKQNDEELYDRTVLMPGVSVSAESWPHEKWEQLAEQLSASGRKVLFLLGPAEKPILERFQLFSDGRKDMLVRQVSSLDDMLSILSVSKQYIGPSTGITHLASALGLSGSCLYPGRQSMHPDRWAPFQSRLKILTPAHEISATQVVHTLQTEKQPQPKDRSMVSAFVVCKNEEKNIRRCLQSISWCDEIVIVDSGSVDKTLEICREFERVRIIEREWPGHREQKQFALEQCTHKWVLNLDADEELSSELKAEIMRILRQDKHSNHSPCGFYLCRLVYFLERWWDRGGWHPEHRMRFFQRKFAHWGGINPHEKAIIDGKTAKLRGYIYHYTYDSYKDLISTLNRFSTLSAEALHRRGVKVSLKKLLFHPPMRFVKFYLLRFGFIEGVAGLQVAFAESFSTFLKYAKLFEIQHFSENIAELKRGPNDKVESK